MTRQICLHGAESTGKSALAPRLAKALGGVVVPEYGRSYAEAHGTDLDADDLLAIFAGHVATTRVALAVGPDWLVSDTDPLMTQAWAIMLLGRRLPGAGDRRGRRCAARHRRPLRRRRRHVRLPRHRWLARQRRPPAREPHRPRLRLGPRPGRVPVRGRGC